MLDTDEIEDLYTDVLGKLTIRVGATTIRSWGYLTIKDWVRNHAEQGESDPDRITNLILEDWENENQ